jgi:hypothetical protein
MKKVLLTLMFVPVIGFGQSREIVEFVSKETYDIKHADSARVELTFNIINPGAPGYDEPCVKGQLVLHYYTNIEGDHNYSFPFSILKGHTIEIKYKGTQFIGIVY